MLNEIRNYKKIDYWDLKDQPFELKPYFKELTLQEARVKFALDTKMLKGIKGHFSSDPKNENDLWTCQFCLRVETIRHIKNCPYFSNERRNRDLSNVKHLVSYFQEVMQIRMEEDCC